MIVYHLPFTFQKSIIKRHLLRPVLSRSFIACFCGDRPHPQNRGCALQQWNALYRILLLPRFIFNSMISFDSVRMKASSSSLPIVSYRKGDIPQLDYVWEEHINDDDDKTQPTPIQRCRRRRRRRRVHIHLPAIAEMEEYDIMDEDNKKTDPILHATDAVDKENKTDSCNDDSIIPESVLLYQQQLRKRQAAQRASGTIIHSAATTSLSDLLQQLVVYVDDNLIVVNKPSGMLCVPGIHDHPNLLSLVYDHFVVNGDDDTDIYNNQAQVNGDDTTTRSSPAELFRNNPNGMIVHRLDMDTSGLVVFGRKPSIVSALHQQFRDRKVRKEYEALVCGHVQFDDPLVATAAAPNNSSTFMECIHNNNNNSNNHHDDDPNWCGLIDLPLQRDHERPPFMRVATATSEQAASRAVADLQRHGFQKLIRKRPKPSQSEFMVLSYERLLTPTERQQQEQEQPGDGMPHQSVSAVQRSVPWTEEMAITVATATSNDIHDIMTSQNIPLPVTRLKLIPHTGRTHQLRVHCAAIGHAIVGDPAYGMFGEANPNGGFHDDIIQQSFPYHATQEIQNAIRQVHDPTQVMTKVLPTTNSELVPDDGILSSSQPNHPCPNQINENVNTMCLHAKRLGLYHPTTGKYHLWESPAPF